VTGNVRTVCIILATLPNARRQWMRSYRTSEIIKVEELCHVYVARIMHSLVQSINLHAREHPVP